MSLLKFKSEIDLNDPQQTELLQNFIAQLGAAKRKFVSGGEPLFGTLSVVSAPLAEGPRAETPQEAPQEAPQEVPETPKRRRRTKAEIEADKAAEEAPVNEDQAEEVTLATVRKQAKPLLATHRNEIISKFSEMGVTSVAKIKAADLPAFSAFLKGLASE